MDSKAGTLLVPPNVKNVSCSHPRYTGSLIYYIGPFDAIQALLILMLTVGIIGANLLVIFVINHRRYSPYIHPQPRYLLTSLSLNDLAIGLLITPFGVLPALFHCWPYGEIYCQIQALLRGALSQQSAVILVCMAVDRYMCALHPDKYSQHSSKKGCVAILSVTWTLCLTMFGLLVLPKGYYFNNTGLLVCEPFYSKPSHRILATCSLYFPTTMILMYCYGSSFHASSFRLVATPPTVRAVTTPSSTSEKSLFQVVSLERRLNGSASRTMAAMSLGYIVMVTPWAIQEIVAACTNSKVPPFLDFFVTWTAISNSFWNPFIYWLLNAHFRRLGKELFINKCFAPDEELPTSKSRCCSVSSECDPNTLPMPPGPPSSKPPRPDLEGLSEKYWGEILERTVSSNSLHALQRVYGYKTHTSSILEMNGLTSPDDREHSPPHLQQIYIYTVLGAAGGIGQPLSLLLKQCPLIDELALYDIVNTPGVTADLAHINTPAIVSGFHGIDSLNKALHQSDIVMIPAGLPRKPGMTRDDLFASNATIVQELGTAIAKICPQALVGLITNPINSCLPVLCEAMMKEQRFDPRRVIGVTTLDEVGAATFVGIANNVDPSTLSIPVIGGHSGITIVPLLSQCSPSVKVPEKLAQQITENIREAGTRVVEAKAGTGSATISMAWAGARFAVKLVKALRGENNVVTCGYILSDICNTRYFSLPMMLGRPGIRVTYGLPKMNDFEEELLRLAIPELKKDVEKGIQFARKEKFAIEKSAT